VAVGQLVLRLIMSYACTDTNHRLAQLLQSSTSNSLLVQLQRLTDERWGSKPYVQIEDGSLIQARSPNRSRESKSFVQIKARGFY